MFNNHLCEVSKLTSQVKPGPTPIFIPHVSQEFFFCFLHFKWLGRKKSRKEECFVMHGNMKFKC